MKQAEAMIIRLLSLYQRGISPFLGPHCRFYPSCSAYMKEAIVQLGLIRGLWRGACRIAMCHPFSEGGYDPMEASFRRVAPEKGPGQSMTTVSEPYHLTLFNISSQTAPPSQEEFGRAKSQIN